uniref:Uncharacterized protein n=1 Tax=Plectus sambesii TaxID=2011161 RepID=A0A914VXW3_9BILA
MAARPPVALAAVNGRMAVVVDALPELSGVADVRCAQMFKLCECGAIRSLPSLEHPAVNHRQRPGLLSTDTYRLSASLFSLFYLFR